MATHELIAIPLAIVTLAMLTIAITNGKDTAAIFTAAGNAFSNSIKAATLKG
jgi:hypothetical protein